MNVAISYLDYQVDVFFNWPKGLRYKVIRKGRRAGITKGAANACIEWMLAGEGPILWGETTHGNIQRYMERYFEPVMKQNKIAYHWNKLDKQLKIGDQFIDFRSADNPENWEGFSYKKIFLNEAGIILKDRSLYTNSVLPMMLDYPDAVLIAAGVPKGKWLKDGSEHPFYALAKRAESGNEQYEMLCFDSYSNPLLSHDDIKALEDEISMFSPEQVEQEIYGKFIESDALNPFINQFDKNKHESTEAVYDQRKQLIIHLDFNLNPFAIGFSHIWEDREGLHDWQFDEAEIKGGSIPAMVDLVKLRYPKSIFSALVTGDAMGKRGDISQRDNASLYKQFIRGLGISETQLRVTNNPTHENSRADCNYFLRHFPDYKINPVTCPNTIRDIRNVQCDAYGKILKKDRKDLNQRADYIDANLRYKVHNFHRKWIDRHQKQ